MRSGKCEVGKEENQINVVSVSRLHLQGINKIGAKYRLVFVLTTWWDCLRSNIHFMPFQIQIVTCEIIYVQVKRNINCFAQVFSTKYNPASMVEPCMILYLTLQIEQMDSSLAPSTTISL